VSSEIDYVQNGKQKAIKDNSYSRATNTLSEQSIQEIIPQHVIVY